jgi:hypothetical protein
MSNMVFNQKVIDVTYKWLTEDFLMKEGLMPDKPLKPRDRSREKYIYISPEHKEKLRQYAIKNKRAMNAEVELWIDGLKV